MSVGYTLERFHRIAAQLGDATDRLAAAAVVVERSRRAVADPSDARREELADALEEYDRRQRPDGFVGDHVQLPTV